MYKGKKLEESSIIHKSFSSSLLSQTTNQVFERQIDNYTRLLEQDKRKFFRVQQNRNEIAKERSKKAKQLQALKSKAFTSEMAKVKAKVKILENELDQTINSYNDVLASNKKLKGQIDELRKEKLNQRDVMSKITSQIEEYSHLVAEEQALAAKRKAVIDQDKQGIISIKNQNDLEFKQFREEISQTKQNLGGGKLGVTLLRHRGEIEPKGETDTLPLVRFRMRHLIAKNKERVKVIEGYRKTMEAIRKGFQQIKEESGVNDLEQITSTFLKQQQQNHFIYQYIGKLNREIQDLTDEVDNLKNQVERQSQINHEYIRGLATTPQKAQLMQDRADLQSKWTEQVVTLEQFLSQANEQLKGLSGFQDVSRFNLTQGLAKLEQIIDEKCPFKEELNSTTNFHQDATKYTKIPPNCSEQLKQNRQQKILDSQKLRQFASDFWEKRKGKPQSK